MYICIYIYIYEYMPKSCLFVLKLSGPSLGKGVEGFTSVPNGSNLIYQKHRFPIG